MKAPTLTTSFLTLLCFCQLAAPAVTAAEPWSTYRGNPQRTGNTDGSAGPATPKVLWVHKSAEVIDHFIASPLPFEDRLYLTGFGGLNVGTLYAFNTDPKAAQRVAWTKTAPFLKQPSVSTPAVAEGKLIFGDGMHQTNGAYLHCLQMEKGQRVWQYAVPGDLVHLEGSPTVDSGRVVLGGGSAGVICVDLNRVTLDGKEMALTAIQKLRDQKWAQLQAEYEKEKKANPMFAIPPTEDQLPKPSPVRLWQQGQEKWHVDAPIAVAEGQVLVASAFLDKEQVGDRALFSLDLRNGAILWRAPLKLNPWGGPSVSGNTIVVTGSTIGYDLKSLKSAKGDIVALNLKDGKEKWRKEIPAGVVSCAVLTKDLAITTATDGKVRAFDLESGERRWIYTGKSPFFAPVAYAAGVAYAGDLSGVIHAIDVTSGTAKWTLDLGSEPAVKAPGSVYGGPVLQNGRLFVATTNLEGTLARQPTVVVCIGEK